MTTLDNNAEYEIVDFDDGSFGVRIISNEGLPVVMDGFATRLEAENWAYSQQIVTTTETELPPHL